MQVENEFSVESIIQTAKTYFPFITTENFADIFKLKPEHIARHLVMTSENTIRDFLILLYWLRHASSIRCIAALFGLHKSRTSVILTTQLKFWSEKAKEVISMGDAQVDLSFFLPDCVGAVDASEFHINAWVADAFSGKQGYYEVIFLY